MTRMFNKVSRTFNPVLGCLHDCSYCWARKLAEGRLSHLPRYALGFQPYLVEGELKRTFHQGLIFVSSMGDLFGHWVPGEWIEKVLEVVRRSPEADFLFLTKNPVRYLDFHFPSNVILGATLETDLDYPVSKAPSPGGRALEFARVLNPQKMVSIEPIMDFYPSHFVRLLRSIQPAFVFVGYDNYHNKLPEPSLAKTRELIHSLQKFTVVYPKTLREAWR